MNQRQPLSPLSGTRFLTALPVFNEVTHVDQVLDLVAQFSPHVLVVDDGSTDGTTPKLRQRQQERDDFEVLYHGQNQGYGGALVTAFQYAIAQDFEWLVTIDCDGQHQPNLIGRFIEHGLATKADIVSGSRYLKQFDGDSLPPEQRMWVNRQITNDLNRMCGFQLTDAFCGFKAYQVAALRKLNITEFGYGMPLQLWVQAACHRIQVVELAVPRVYTQEHRSFGEELDDTATRLNYYLGVIEKSVQQLPSDCAQQLSLSST